MALICPVSDLRSYNSVLEQVSSGSPVYLAVNGRARYTIRVMCELNAGLRSGEEEGWVSEDDVRAHFHNKRK